jgi:hypothetical protein
MMAAVETFDRLVACVVCGENIAKGVGVLKNHTTGQYVTRDEVKRLEGTPAYEDCSLYYAGPYCFQVNKLQAYVA